MRIVAQKPKASLTNVSPHSANSDRTRAPQTGSSEGISALARSIQSSGYVVAQRKQLSGMFGDLAQLKGGESLGNETGPPTPVNGQRVATIQLKGVGGSKIAFEKRVDESRKQMIEEGMALLKTSWEEARAARRLKKDKIGKDMAEYDEAVKAITKFEKDVKEGKAPDKTIKETAMSTISRLDAENDRRNRPLVYATKDLAEKTLRDLQVSIPAKQLEIDNKRAELFYESSDKIFPVKRQFSDLNDVERRTTGGLMGQISQHIDMKKLNGEMKVLKDSKVTAEKQANVQPETGGLTQVYFDSVSKQIPNEEDLLKETAAFKGGTLSLAGSEITYHGKENVIIADLRKGTEAYVKSQDPTGPDQPREVYTKKSLGDLKTRDSSPKEYVKDTRGALTRRYAYVEKNYYQMMEFFMVGHMTGRFQQYMLAGGERKPGVYKITTEMIKNVPKQPHTQTELTDTQVAVSHQMYGSLPEQRGVSLTSTPKVGVTYANTGGNFRTDEGFKLKVDLARVPQDVLFLNHYAEGGVSGTGTDYTTKQTHKGPGKEYSYKYEESAAHARELFLEQIRPEWVVEIEHHAKGGFENVAGKKTILKESSAVNLLESAKKMFGGEEYEQGFEVGLTGGTVSPTLATNSDYKKGKGTGEMVKEGFVEGEKVAKSKGGKSDHMVAFKEIMEEKAIQDKMSPFHIGYAQGRTGQPMVRSASEFRRLMNLDMSFTHSTKPGDVTVITQDAGNLYIRSPLTGSFSGSRTKVVKIPLEDLRNATIETEEEDDGVQITIKKKSGEYVTLLPEAEAERFTQAIQQCISRVSQNLRLSGVEGGDRVLLLDTKTLELETQTKSTGGYSFKKTEIPVADIRKVDFEREEALIQISISHRVGAYEMNVAHPEAVKVRSLLISNGLSESIVGKVPDIR